MKLYLFYIYEDNLRSEIKYTVSLVFEDIKLENGKLKLYAFTNNKKNFKLFKEERNDKLIPMIYSIDKLDYERFYKKYPDFIIDYYEYIDYKNSVKILSTKNEYNHCKYGWTNMIELPIELEYVTHDLIQPFKKKIRRKMDNLGLDAISSMSDERYEDLAMFSDIIFDDSTLIIPSNENINVYQQCNGLKINGNTLNIFIHEFGYLLDIDIDK